jgi:hypothetical protein
MTPVFASIITQDGTVIVCCSASGLTASGPSKADAERRLTEKRNIGSPRLPSDNQRETAA